METTEVKKVTLGEYRVGSSLGPSNNPLIEAFNQKAAAFIDNANTSFIGGVDTRPDAREFANGFRVGCTIENLKTSDFEVKRCFAAADKFMGQAEAALAMNSYEDAHVLAEIAAMFAVKGVTKPAFPEHLK